MADGEVTNSLDYMHVFGEFITVTQRSVTPPGDQLLVLMSSDYRCHCSFFSGKIGGFGDFGRARNGPNHEAVFSGGK